MSESRWRVRALGSIGPAEIDGLTDVLIDCVEGGASVSFMLPLTRARARAFWERVAHDAEAGDRVVLVAEDEGGICGTVQLVLGLPENQPHRADLAKMLVHRRARRRGLGAALVQAAEKAAVERGRTLLVLDTVTGADAERLYTRLGWTRVGDIPRYALMPDGPPCSTTVFYRDLRSADSATASSDSASTSATLAARIAPLLSVRRGKEAIAFYQAAFGAVETLHVEDPTGAVVSTMRVGEAEFWVADESPAHANFSPETLSGSTARMILIVADPDAAFARAIGAGAREVVAVANAYGWRLGRVVDPYGHHWEIGKPLR